MSAPSASVRPGPPAAPRALLASSAVMIAALAITAIGPFDRLTWWLEVAPVLIVLPLLWATRERFPLSALLYALIAVHAVILCVGGHWTYARVPAGDWVQQALGLARNPYDRLGHLAQGFIPAVAAREILTRRSPLRGSAWLPVLVVATCLAISACYEFVEWGSAVLLGQGADQFLGTQGDPWDTQWDMFCALIGATAAMLLLPRVHDRSLARLPGGGA
jgi:putative membrane protein